MKKSLAKYCENNILNLPNALYGMSDVEPLLYGRESVIFYKNLQSNLNNVEIHTSKACLVYIENGFEVITTCDNDTIELFSDDIIFFPKGVNFHSDYASKDGPPSAFVIFFGDEVITQFLSTKSEISEPGDKEKSIYKIARNSLVKELLCGLQAHFKAYKNSKELLNLKLLELLFLLDLKSDNDQLCNSLSAIDTGKPRRNIKRLLDQYAVSNLKISDYAALSGRSVASFHRDFKEIYKTSPKQWLIDKRLSHAHDLLVHKEWSVTDTAIEVGYENISHFIESFKKKYDKTPHQIKRCFD